MMHSSIFRAGTVDGLDDLRAKIPAAFADRPHESRSEKFAHINSSTVIEALLDRGFVPVYGMQSRVRDASRHGFQRHMIRMRHRDQSFVVGNTVAEVVMRNAHDGSNRYCFDGGLFRVLCSNGMVISDGMCESIRVPHRGNVVEAVLEGSFQVIAQANAALEKSAVWRQIMLSSDQQMDFASRAHALRFGEAAETTPIKPEQLLEVRRYGDDGSDLWHVLNRIQEGCIRGGATGRTRPTRRFPQGRSVTMRGIAEVTRNVEVNKGLWALAQEFSEAV